MEKRSTPGRASADKRTGPGKQGSGKSFRSRSGPKEEGKGSYSRPSGKSTRDRSASPDRDRGENSGSGSYSRPGARGAKTDRSGASGERTRTSYPHKEKDSRPERKSASRSRSDERPSRPGYRTRNTGEQSDGNASPKRYTSERTGSPYPRKERDSRPDRKPGSRSRSDERPPRPGYRTREAGEPGDGNATPKRYSSERTGSPYPRKERDSRPDRKPGSRSRSDERPPRPGYRTREAGEQSDGNASPKRYNSERTGSPYPRKDRDSRPERKSESRSRSDERPSRQLGKSSYSPKKTTNSRESKPRTNEGDGLRLNKYIASTGLCSRREADEMIEQGLITVNGQVITELGIKIGSGDEVRFNGELLKEERKVYVLLNKPKDVTTTTDDPHAKITVMDLVRKACRERLFPVGRLDRSTTGVLLLTNDGELAKKLTHPKYNKRKVYHVFLDKKLKNEDFRKIMEGVMLEDGFIQPDEMHYVEEEDHSQLGLEIHSGRNRIVRRIFEHFGYRIKKLDRVYFAGLTKKGVERGHWRFLTDREIKMLKTGAYE